MSRFGEISSAETHAAKHNLSASVNPTSGDDSNDGYEVGSTWFNTTLNLAFECIDASVGAAKWKLLNWAKSIYAYNMVGASFYTWNGTTVGSTGTSVLGERWLFNSFSGIVGADGCFDNFDLPESYTAGNDIKVILNVTADSTGGDSKWFIGLTRPDGSGLFGSVGDENETEWLSDTVTHTLNWPVLTPTVVFDGTNLNPGDPISIKVYRDPGDVADTDTATAYLNSMLMAENS